METGEQAAGERGGRGKEDCKKEVSTEMDEGIHGVQGVSGKQSFMTPDSNAVSLLLGSVGVGTERS